MEGAEEWEGGRYSNIFVDKRFTFGRRGVFVFCLAAALGAVYCHSKHMAQDVYSVLITYKQNIQSIILTPSTSPALVFCGLQTKLC